MGWFADRTAVVTGAAHGIGEAVARQLQELGARVVAVDINDAGLRAAFPGEAVNCVVGDLAGDDTGGLAADIIATYGPVTLLVNNVGIDTPHDFFSLERPDFERVMATNLRGPWFFTRRITEDLIERAESGALVFVSSLHDRFVYTHPHYSASKAAVSMLVRELAQRLGPHGIRVNAVSPGAIRTRPRTDAEEQRYPSLVPIGRLGEPRDVARVAALLLSDEWCGYVTGANVPVDGGLGLHSWSLDL
jgi:NAD(P)-dependent dehydrogenase (short-subunit alcohol dehydrogenase family)